jgi:hypothetical protein
MYHNMVHDYIYAMDNVLWTNHLKYLWW